MYPLSEVLFLVTCATICSCGRIETRIATASANIGWIVADRSFPGQTKFKNVNTILKIVRRTEHADRSTFSTHDDISSAPRDAVQRSRMNSGRKDVPRASR